jgi:pyruvate/2-oxoglutarate dehydrogenase complex dihydrolipoamide dehydrogenase (E3) component
MVDSVESMTGSVDPDRTEWDVIVIGGGPPGDNVAAYASDGSGLSVVIVEQELIGRECSYWTCMPSKALLRPVEVLDSARRLPGAQQALDGRTVDVAAVLARRDAFTSHRCVHLPPRRQLAGAVGERRRHRYCARTRTTDR